MARALHTLLLLAVGAALNFLFAADVVRQALPARAPAPAKDAATHPRVVVLGFDGVDPRWLERMFGEGKLANLKRLADEGSFFDLATEVPPESPVAWATLLTGVNPGRHNITDFVIPGSDHRPQNGMVEVRPIRLLLGLVPVRGPRVTSLLKAPTFLEHVYEAGYTVISLRQPHGFPATQRPGFRILSGLGTPDLAASSGLYEVWSDRVGFTAGTTVFGGLKISLRGGDRAGFLTVLPGPYDPTLPRAPNGDRQRTTVPLRLDRATYGERPAVRISLQGASAVVPEGERSGFLPVEYRLGTIPAIPLRGHVRFEVRSVRPLTVFCDPIQPDVAASPIPLASPAGYGRELWARYGPFETVGWAEQTFQLNDGVQDDRGFLRDLIDDMDRGAGMLLGELKRGSNCAFYAFTATDRACHCFYRYYDDGHWGHQAAMKGGLEDPVGVVFERMDRIVGDVRAMLGPDDLLLVVSDHGFQTWRWSMNVNRWLLDNGYLVLRGKMDPQTLASFFGGGDMGLDAVDWGRTKAFSMGLGQVFVNARGRWAEGSVAPEAVDGVVRELRTKLLEVRNPEVLGDDGLGERVLTEVYLLHDIYRGPYAKDAADLQLGFARGYRVSWQSALLGGIGGPVIERNEAAWSGDHCSTDPRQVPGVLLSNRRFATPPADRPYHLHDIAPTVLTWFGIPLGDLEGTPIR